MRSSRGMGDINPSKMPGKKIIKRKDKPQDVEMYAKGGEVWNKPRPKDLGKPKKLDSAKKAKAKAMAKGGMAKESMGPRTMSKDVEKGSNSKLKHGEHGIQKKGHTRAMMPKMKGRTI